MCPKGLESHFHIYWCEKNDFDWEAFASYDGAALRALQLALPYESFSIRGFTAECPVCKSSRASGINLEISD
jgi:hypothetical protein